jgi:cytochrome c5
VRGTGRGRASGYNSRFFSIAASLEEAMHEPHHHDPIEDNVDSHPAKVAIYIVVGAVALIIGLILLTHLAGHFYGTRDMKEDPSMSDKAVAQRLAPVAHVAIDPNAPATPAAVQQVAIAAPAPAAGAAAPAGGAGKATFDTVCTACHATGVAGAPKYGDKAAWAPRIAQGKAALYNSALHGKNAMPAKGGNPALSDDAVKAAVDYMAAAAK